MYFIIPFSLLGVTVPFWYPSGCSCVLTNKHGSLRRCASSPQAPTQRRAHTQSHVHGVWLPQPVFHPTLLEQNTLRCNKKAEALFFCFFALEQRSEIIQASPPPRCPAPLPPVPPLSDLQRARTQSRLNLWQLTRRMSLSHTFVFTQVPGWSLNQIALACSQGLRWSLFGARSDPLPAKDYV